MKGTSPIDCSGQESAYNPGMKHPDTPVHIPVLHSTDGHSPVLEYLKPEVGESVLDVTVGLGGHSDAFLKVIGETGTLTALDADAKNLKIAEERLGRFPGTKNFLHHNFGKMAELSLPLQNIIFADLGVSSPHFDDASRGFSFRFEGPLDLRFDQTRGKSCSDFLGIWGEEEISDILFHFGEIRDTKRLARALFELGRSNKHEMLQTGDVKKCVEAVFRHHAQGMLPQVFQALRIAVNRELQALESFLEEAPKLLLPGGRLGIISYHSLEDRLVKQAFKSLSSPKKDPEKGSILEEAPFELLTPKAVKPSDEEIARNPRARSARFRILTRRR